ncbi:hypothetical protein CAURIS_11150 [Corynebacterium auris]|nr:hypothetical protein CAURIS_11150 [Corynebacterium auris]
MARRPGRYPLRIHRPDQTQKRRIWHSAIVGGSVSTLLPAREQRPYTTGARRWVMNSLPKSEGCRLIVVLGVVVSSAPAT